MVDRPVSPGMLSSRAEKAFMKRQTRPRLVVPKFVNVWEAWAGVNLGGKRKRHDPSFRRLLVASNWSEVLALDGEPLVALPEFGLLSGPVSL
jgi:hypothetical protein